MADPDFTFDAAQPLSHETMGELLTAILNGKKPTVLVTNVGEVGAKNWLEDQHRRYVASIGEKRSAILKAMRIANRVEVVGSE